MKSVISPQLVARQAELAYLQDLVQQVAGEQLAPGAQLQVVLISGEAGIGKSRLAAAAATFARSQGCFVLCGFCYESDRTRPYALLHDLAQHAAAEGRWPPDLAQAIDGVAPNVLSTPAPSEINAAPLPFDVQKHRLFEAFARHCQGLTGRAPLLLLLEDMHWCDDSTLELLTYLVRRNRQLPLILLMTARADEIPPSLNTALAEFARLRLCRELPLRPLDRSDVDVLLRAIFDQARPIRADFLDAIYTLSEGNPFYVEEVLQALVTAGDIYYAGGAWDRKPLGEIRIPRSIQEVVRRRREQLSPQARALLELAAVAGRRFDFTLLLEVSAVGEHELLDRIKELLVAQMIVEEAPDRYAFRHALLREAIYKSLLGRERMALHRRIAKALLARLQDSPAAGSLAVAAEDPPPGEVAYHCAEGQLWPQALQYACTAGDSALALYAPRAAIEHYSRALHAAERLRAPEGAILLRRGRAHALRSEFARACADYECALLEAGTTDGVLRWEALLALGQLWGTRSYARMGEYLQEALAAARKLHDDARIGRTLNQLGNWRMNLDQPFAALECHTEALAIFRRLEDRPGIAETLDLLAIVHYNCGDLLGGRRCYEEAIPLWRDLHDHRGLLHSLGGLGLRADFTLEYDPTPVAECLVPAEESVAIARTIEWQSAESLALICAGLVELQMGAWSEALHRFEGALTIAREIEHPGWLADSLHALGVLLTELGEYAAAETALEESLAIAHQHHAMIWVRQAGAALAVLYARVGKLAAGRAVLAAVHAAETGGVTSVSPPHTGVAPGPSPSPSPSPSSGSSPGAVADPATAPPGASLQQRLLAAADIELLLAAGEAAAALAAVDALIATTANLAADTAAGLDAVDAAGGANTAIFPAEPGAGAAPRVVPRLWHLRGLALAGAGRYLEAAAALAAALAAARRQGRLPLAAQTAAALTRVWTSANNPDLAAAYAAECRAIVTPLLARLPATGVPFPGASDQTLRRSAEAAAASWLHREALIAPKLPSPTLPLLTARETEVALLVARGLSNRAIADALVISERTAERHVANIMAKLNVNTRAQIAVYAAAGAHLPGE